MASEIINNTTQSYGQPKRTPSKRIRRSMDNVEVSKSITYKIHMHQRTVRSDNRKYRAHDAMHPSCMALLIG